MSREVSSTKKRRLESEQSQASGITILSNITQTTELSSDLDDSNSDTSSTNQKNGCFDSRSNVTNDVMTNLNNSRARNARKACRKRQVSWSLECDGDEDETFLKECASPEVPAQPRPSVPYDNNFTGTNNSRQRTRRATESSIDNHALSYFQPQPPFSGLRDESNQRSGFPPPRSRTASQIHDNENEIERQRLIEELVRDYDARRTMQQGRSQSVTSLRSDRTQNLNGSHMYESLHTPVTNNRPADTIVTMSNPDRNYLHPTTETQIQRNIRDDSFMTLNNASGCSGDGSSSYADVNRYIESSTGSHHHPHQTLCIDHCKSSFYRKGFYVLLVLNVILVLLNSFGLPFVYFTIKQEGKQESNEQGVTSALTSKACLKFDNLHPMIKNELKRAGVMVTEDQYSCVNSTGNILSALIGIVNNILRVPSQDKTAEVPVVQLKASTRMSGKSKTIVEWDKRPEINTAGTEIKDNTKIKINKTGYYYVYSRVHYVKPKPKDKENDDNNEFTVGHRVVKISGNDHARPIDEIVQRCFPSNTTGDVRHTTHLGSVQHLEEGDTLFLQLDHTQYFDHNNTLFGMFLVAT